MTKLNYLLYVPLIVLYPIGMVLGGIGAGCIILGDMLLDKIPNKNRVISVTPNKKTLRQ
jgi:hypothetical protein